MPEYIAHSALAARFSELVLRRLEVLRASYSKGSCTWGFLKNIERMGTGAILLNNGQSIQPDDQFQIKDEFPSVLVEGGDSGRFGGKNGLARKMHTAITDGRIKAIIGLELRSTRPRLSMYTAQLEPQNSGQILVKSKIVLDRVYLDSGGSLELHINNFAADELIQARYPGLDQAARITIPLEEILNAIRSLPLLREKREESYRINSKLFITEPSTPSPAKSTPSPTKSTLSLPAKSRSSPLAQSRLRLTKPTLSKRYWYLEPHYFTRSSVGS